ncbi:MAG: PhoH family protein [Flavobacteriales bacterium]|nr:PhoH family protein [Flavobacteriales bacterium]
MEQERLFLIDALNPVNFFGPQDANLRFLRDTFPRLRITARGDNLKVLGQPGDVEKFANLLHRALIHLEQRGVLTPHDLEHLLRQETSAEASTVEKTTSKEQEKAPGDLIVTGNDGLQVKARTLNQKKLVEAAYRHDLVFAIGPSGTGKTYTAVALAVKAMRNKEVRRIILTRPAVEAGENLGFLPGDLKDKLDPYLQPLYDALRDMIPQEKLRYLMENGLIQIAPLAYMRGRTLDNAFVILDEAQNATHTQMKMFLTRMGQNARFIITGDLTQVDLPPRQRSGLPEALRLLKDIPGIGCVFFDRSDVVRHPLVRKVLEAYESVEKKTTHEAPENIPLQNT